MLSGDVQDFALRDVLQLLSKTNKSGLLTLYQAGSSGGVFVRDGGVCLALVDVTRVPLGRRIVAAGLAEAKVVRTTLRAVDSSTFDSACALMRLVSDAGKARALAAEHTRDAIGWLSQYAEARFTFDPTVKVEAWPFEPLATADVLADLERTAPQWAELHAVVGDLSLVPHCVPSPRDSADVTLTTQQWRVVALVDGRRSVRDLAELVGLGQLELCRELGGLVDRGLVELVASDGRRAVGTPLPDVELGDVVPDVVQEAADEPDTPGGPNTAEPDIPGGPSILAGPATAGPESTGDPAELADANVGLLNRLIGKGRAT